jgi:asparagine synthetase B (glutamine-hydrolysing)
MSELGAALTQVLSRLPPTGPVPLALSGGIDSWVLALLLRSTGRTVAGYSLVSGVPGYCEWEQVEQLALRFEIPVEPIPAADFEAALPRFLAVTRTPIYNLHPVSKLLLAEGLAARNVSYVVSGDAADQVFRCESECDLLPLTQACFAHARVRLETPFLAPEIGALCRVPDPEKQPLRALAASLGIPHIPKRPTYYPGGSILAHTRRLLEAQICVASPD